MNDWDADSDRLFANLRSAARAVRDAARARQTPSVDLARGWHATTMQGLQVVVGGKVIADHGFFGSFRGEPGLEDVGVEIGGRFGIPPGDVAQQLAAFEATLGRAVEALDRIIPAGVQPADADQLNAVIVLCAWAHSEWVRIHPFANGNGRTARMWANYIATRYGLPPFVILRPRPDGGYGDAGSAAMDGDWRPTTEAFRRLYLDAVARG